MGAEEKGLEKPPSSRAAEGCSSVQTSVETHTDCSVVCPWTRAGLAATRGQAKASRPACPPPSGCRGSGGVWRGPGIWLPLASYVLGCVPVSSWTACITHRPRAVPRKSKLCVTEKGHRPPQNRGGGGGQHGALVGSHCHGRWRNGAFQRD